MMIQTAELKLQFDLTSLDFGSLFVTDRKTGAEYVERGVLHRSAQRFLEMAEKMVFEGRDEDEYEVGDDCLQDAIDQDNHDRAMDMNATLRDIGGGL